MHVSAEPTVIRTVLGSCVAACIYDPVAAVGGMNHFMLPDGCATETVPMRFGSFAMEELLGRVIDGGGVRGRLRAKIFGGAHVLRDAIHSGAIPDSNVRFVREYLSRAGIPIESERVGGKLPMVIRFETHTGKVLLRTIETSEAEKVKTQEARYRQKLNGIARQSEQQIRAAPRIA